MYTNHDFENDCLEIFRNCDGNTVDVPGAGRTVIYEEPLIGFAAASDSLFEKYRDKKAIGVEFMGPREWLPGAETVISLFLPFTEAVRESNRKDPSDPSTEWLYARIEGQDFIGKFMAALKSCLEGKGMTACVPSSDERFDRKIEMTLNGLKPDFHADSRWSERHAAYACGLGTFGLSKGLITEKGMAGRFASIIISEKLEPAERPYTGIYDYCINCGACVRRCPVNAISLSRGKNNLTCHLHVQKMGRKYSPRYGCGKCQVAVPCEHARPLKAGQK